MEDVQQAPPPPEPPWVHFAAVALEIGIFARFIIHGDGLGIVLCGLYLWWSASWSLVLRFVRGE